MGKNFFSYFSFILVWNILDDVRAWLRNPVKSQTIVQNSPVPVNLNAGGQQISAPPPVYVYVEAQNKEQNTGKIVEKQNQKIDPDILIQDNKPIYKLRYNGKDFIWESPISNEKYKFEKGQFTMDRTTEINVNVEVPQPIWGIGIGKSFKGNYAIQADVRIGKTPFNVWGYASDKDQSIGIKFVQYETKGKTEDKNAVSKEGANKASEK